MWYVSGLHLTTTTRMGVLTCLHSQWGKSPLQYFKYTYFWNIMQSINYWETFKEVRLSLIESVCIISGLHVARIHEQEVWRNSDPHVLGHVISSAVYSHQDLCECPIASPEKYIKSYLWHCFQACSGTSSLVLVINTRVYLQVNLYSGALFIQQALQWNLYISVFLLLAATAITTVTGQCQC